MVSRDIATAPHLIRTCGCAPGSFLRRGVRLVASTEGWPKYLLCRMTGNDMPDMVMCMVLYPDMIAGLIQDIRRTTMLHRMVEGVSAVEYNNDDVGIYEVRLDLFFDDGEDYKIQDKRPPFDRKDEQYGYTYRYATARYLRWRLSEKYTGRDVWSAQVMADDLWALFGSGQLRIAG